MNKAYKVKEIKPNKLEVVKSQMNPKWGEVAIPETITIRGKKDEECYVVAVVDRLHNPISEDYDTVVRLVKYRLEAYVSMKEHFKRAGLKNMFILHDPTFVEKVSIADLNVAEAVDLINAVESVEELIVLVGEDERKGVLDAFNKKIEELKG